MYGEYLHSLPSAVWLWYELEYKILEKKIAFKRILDFRKKYLEKMIHFYNGEIDTDPEKYILFI